LLVRVGERWEGETKKWALAIVRGKCLTFPSLSFFESSRVGRINRSPGKANQGYHSSQERSRKAHKAGSQG
jgi:hypothetical protein